jgi:hypothetical protein
MKKPIRILNQADEALLRSDQERRAVEFVGNVIAHCRETNLYASALNTLIQNLIKERSAKQPRKKRQANEPPPVQTADVLDLCRQLDSESEAKRAAIQRAEEAEQLLTEVAAVVHENRDPKRIRARLFRLLAKKPTPG